MKSQPMDLTDSSSHLEPTSRASLPPEILISVIGHLEAIDDLRNVRLCCKFLAATGASNLFHTLVVLFSSESFWRARHVAQHEHLRLCVRKIKWVPNRFMPHLDLAQWRHYYGGLNQFNAAVWLRKPYEQYCKLSEDQHVSENLFQH